jgi:hypothetical protein
MPGALEFLRLNDKAYLLVRNPFAVFVCWTWSVVRAEAFASGAYEPEVTVRLAASDDMALFVECSAPWNAGKLYIKPPAGGRVYTASVYARRKDGPREKLLESNAALTPLSSPGSGLSAGYASAEFFRKEPA